MPTARPGQATNATPRRTTVQPMCRASEPDSWKACAWRIGGGLLARLAGTLLNRKPQVLPQEAERPLPVDRVPAVEELDLRPFADAELVVQPADLGVLVGHPF